MPAELCSTGEQKSLLISIILAQTKCQILYQGFAPVGGGAFSGKDPSKVDRSGAYKAREIAVYYLKKYHLKWCKVQLSYAIGIKKPLAIYIDSDKGMLNEEVTISKYDSLYTECEPKNIIDDLNLLNKCYYATSMYGHF